MSCKPQPLTPQHAVSLTPRSSSEAQGNWQSCSGEELGLLSSDNSYFYLPCSLRLAFGYSYSLSSGPYVLWPDARVLAESAIPHCTVSSRTKQGGADGRPGSRLPLWPKRTASIIANPPKVLFPLLPAGSGHRRGESRGFAWGPSGITVNFYGGV